MPDYRSDDSIPEKRRLIEESYGDTIPAYMLFHLGEIARLTDEEEEMLNELFFQGRTPGFGDKELHRSNGYSGSYLGRPLENLKPFVVLRIRDATAAHYAMEIGGQRCHLIQVSNGDNTKPIINFLERWGSSPQDVRKSATDSPIRTPANPWGRPTAFVETDIFIAVTTPSDESPAEPYEAMPSAGMNVPPPSKKGPISRFLDWFLG